MIQFPCPACQRLVVVPDHLAGQTRKCKGCGKKYRVPAKPAPPPGAVPSVVTFACPTCAAALQVGVESIGQLVQCPGCRGLILAPASAVPQPPVAGRAPTKPALDPNWRWHRVRWGLTLLNVGTGTGTVGVLAAVLAALMVNWSRFVKGPIESLTVAGYIGLGGLIALVVAYFLILFGEGLACWVPRECGIRRFPILALTFSLVTPLVVVAGLLFPPLVFLGPLGAALRYLFVLQFLKGIGAVFQRRQVQDMAVTQIIFSMSFAAGSFLFFCVVPVGIMLAAGIFSVAEIPAPAILTWLQQHHPLAQVRGLGGEIGVVAGLIVAVWLGLLVMLAIGFSNLIGEAQDAVERGTEGNA